MRRVSRKKSRKKYRGILRLALICFFLGTILIGWSVYDFYKSSYEEQLLKEKLVQLRESKPIQENALTANLGSSLAVLQKVNNEIVAWIRIEGTDIDYPVVQHEDNDYYLGVNYDGQKSKYGSIFMDYRCKPDQSERHIILYGHNMKDGMMFGALKQYRDEEFFYSHRQIKLDTLYGEGIWEIFSAYVMDSETDTIEMQYEDDKAFLDRALYFKTLSLYETDTIINANDRILTLITCTGEAESARMVVHAIWRGLK